MQSAVDDSFTPFADIARAIVCALLMLTVIHRVQQLNFHESSLPVVRLPDRGSSSNVSHDPRSSRCVSGFTLVLRWGVRLYCDLYGSTRLYT
jgi:hypothetical protein